MRTSLKQSKTVRSDWQYKIHNEASYHWSSTRFDCWSSPFNIFINDIIKACSKFAFILYADDTTLNSTLDSFGNDAEEIQNSIISELKKVFKWLDVNKLCLNFSKSKFMLFQMPQKKVPNLLFNIDRMHIE